MKFRFLCIIPQKGEWSNFVTGSFGGIKLGLKELISRLIAFDCVNLRNFTPRSPRGFKPGGRGRTISDIVKTLYPLRIQGFLMVAETGLEPAASGL
jgi:hypothetical protein